MDTDDQLPRFNAAKGYEPYGRRRVSDPPGLDCIVDHHFWIENIEPGAFPTSDGQPSWASWCLWCGGAVTNEYVPPEEDSW
jgi:hypothetical protein